VLRPAIEMEVSTREKEHTAAPPTFVRPLERPGIAAEARAAVILPPRSTAGNRSESRATTAVIEGAVRVASGPWEVEEGWWTEEAVRREYWDVEIDGGGVYRLYRDRRSERWFLDGIYD
jgi:protein ImuB